MKKIVIILFCFNILSMAAGAQNYYENLQKYWWYRYTLVNEFMKVGGACGESIPAELKHFDGEGGGTDPN